MKIKWKLMLIETFAVARQQRGVLCFRGVCEEREGLMNLDKQYSPRYIRHTAPRPQQCSSTLNVARSLSGNGSTNRFVLVLSVSV